MMKLMHIALDEPDPRIWSAVFRKALDEFGQLEVIAHGRGMTEDQRAALVRETDVLLTGWNAAPIPACIAEEPGRLQYICNITGEIARFIPMEIVESGLPVTNWGDYPAVPVAEGALALLLAVLKDMHCQINTVREGGWRMDMHEHGGSIEGSRMGIYGLGVIGRRFIELLRPFRCSIKVFDPYVEVIPANCERCHSLEDLFDSVNIIVIHAALTEETRKSVTADLLARLPRHGVVINTARGGIVDQDALFAELESGRLRAGLDVLDPDYLPPDHPARTWENLILTAHRVEQGWPDFHQEPTRLNRMQEICIDNLRRFQRGEPLKFTFSPTRYLLST
ncbi:MAG: hypothetical protein PWP23_1149 [Candidatus Sumerlaeota bacterium]|nr:hypothetical protein [Candidatus Sumerlaeota bacterium]